MRWQSRRAVVLLGLLTLSAATAATAGNNIFIVPHGTATFQIDEEALLRGAGNGAQILAYTLPSRGTLDRIQDGSQDRFEYTPHTDQEFWTAGMDSFRYVSTGESAIVFLLADVPKMNLLPSDLELEIDISPRALSVRRGAVDTPHPNVDEIALRTGSNAAYLSARFSDVGTLRHGQDEVNPGGCECGGGIEPPPVGLPADEVLTLATILGTVGGTEETEIELFLSYENDTYFLGIRGPERNNSALVPLEAGKQDFALRWWQPTATAAAEDGAITLEVGGEMVASLFGFGSFTSLTNDVELRLGVQGPSAAPAGILTFHQPRFLVEDGRRQILHPIFADGVESDGSSEDFAAWTAVVGSPEVSAAARIHGDLGIEVPVTSAPAYLIDDSPGGKPHYRARFSLGFGSLNLDTGDQITLLEGLAGDEAARPFSVHLRQDTLDFELCAEARSVESPIQMCCRVPWLPTSLASHSLEVQWWATPTTPIPPENNGGLRLWLRGIPDTEPCHLIEVLGLDNSGQIIDEVHFGAINPQVSTTGSAFYLDDFESWH